MKTIGLDVETSREPTMHPWQKEAYLVAVGLAQMDGTTKTWTFNHDEVEFDPFESAKTQKQMIREIQAEVSAAGRIVGHNLKFDINWLRKIGIDFSHCKLYCTMIAEYLLLGQQIGGLTLSKLSTKYLKTPKMDRVRPFWDSGAETSEIPLRILLPYLEQDCINALAIFKRQVPELMKAGMGMLAKVQFESTRILSQIECTGMRFDKENAEQAADDMRKQLNDIDWQLRDAFDFEYNLNSNDELSVALFGGTIKREGTEWVTRELKFETKYYERKCEIEHTLSGVGFTPPEGSELKKQGYYSTDKGTLAQLKCKNKKQKLVKKLLTERSQLTKALSTLVGKNPEDNKGLVNKVQADGCLHSQYNQTVTKTGRLSSKDPNGQNLPREGTSPIKESIVPRYDYIVAADLSQVEWRSAAFLSQDPVMLKEIYGGVDPHADNAINIFGADPEDKDFKAVRTTSKIVTFRLLYGGTAFGFYADPKMPNYSRKKWEKIVDKFYNKYKGLKAWQETNISTVYRNGGSLRNPTGRLFYFKIGPKGYDMRQIKNYPVQSLATADIMPLAMCIIYKQYRALELQSLLIGQVHDSLIWDVPENELQTIAKLCTRVFDRLPQYFEQMWGIEFNVPLGGDIEYGPNYGHMEEYHG